jgi:ribose 5-phosphate isomerase B
MGEGWRVAVGCDDAGTHYKDVTLVDLKADPRVAWVRDLCPAGDKTLSYPEVAIAAAEAVATGGAHRALLVCGTGLGMAITANKVRDLRAVTALDGFSVERSVLSNNAQVLALGERVIG